MLSLFSVLQEEKDADLSRVPTVYFDLRVVFSWSQAPSLPPSDLTTVPSSSSPGILCHSSLVCPGKGRGLNDSC